MKSHLLVEDLSEPIKAVEEVEPEPTQVMEVMAEETPVMSIYDFLAIVNIILWLLYFIGAFDD